MKSNLPVTRTNRGQRGISVAITALLLIFVLPILGLSIDATMLYCVKTKLQGAVDGAALAASKSLSRGADDTAHATAAKNAANVYVRLNYPKTFFFSNDVVVDTSNGVQIDLSVNNQRTVTVTATVAEPALFMKWLNFGDTTVKATATTVRKDVNIVMVLDRSGSMSVSNSCGPMTAAAQNFVDKFTPGRDNLGIISFATTTQEQVKITTNWIHGDDPHETAGTGTANMATALGGISCAGSTSSAEALWYAYNELVGLNQPGALNYIVFFTDGQPTGIDVNMPVNNTPCTASITADVNTVGMASGYTGKYIPAGLLAVFTNGSGWIGLAKPTKLANANGTPVIDNGDQGSLPVNGSTGCAYALNWTSNFTVTTDYNGGVPRKDIYGNDTIDYLSVTMNGNWVKLDAPANGLAVAANTANSAAKHIRHGDPMTVLPNATRSIAGVIIHSIGLGNASVPLSADDTFLARVSNTKYLADNVTLNPGYEPAYGSGVYKYAANTSDLKGAFDDIAGEILRLAK